jgi:hypothetical protein
VQKIIVLGSRLVDRRNPRMVRAYIVRNTWNLVGPDRFVTNWLNRVSVVDEVVEQPEILQCKYWS